MKIWVFPEGKTEEKVIEKVRQVIDGCDFQVVECDGKSQINAKLSSTLSPLLDQPLRCLILRDLDSHANETVLSLAQGVSNALQKMFAERKVQASPALKPLDSYDNILIWQSNAEPYFRLALHIATYRWNPQFIKSTIDDYVLDLALRPEIVTALCSSQKLTIERDRLIAKITDEIPQIVQNNGIPLEEAKDYVRLYAAVIKTHTSPPVFAGKALAHTDPSTFQDTFKSLFAAVEYLR